MSFDNLTVAKLRETITDRADRERSTSKLFFVIGKKEHIINKYLEDKRDAMKAGTTIDPKSTDTLLETDTAVVV
jgi:hypothetical protein